MNRIKFSPVLQCALAALFVSGLTACPPAPPTQQPSLIIVDTVADLVGALDDLPATGGRIVVKAGTYTLTDSIEVTGDNIIIEGEGAATYFRLANDTNRPCFVLGEPSPAEPAVTHRNIVLKNLRIDGNRENQTSEFSGEAGQDYLRNNCVTVRGCVDTTVQDVILESARSGGVVTERGCENIVLEGITAFDNEFDGIACYDTTLSLITGCTSRDNVAAGLSCDLGFDDNVVSECFFVGNGTVGVFMRDSTGNLIGDSMMSENAQDGVFIADGDAPTNLPTTQNIFMANFYTDNERYGFWQAGANSVDNVVHGGIFEGNGEGAIQESFPQDAPLIRYAITLIP